MRQWLGSLLLAGVMLASASFERRGGLRARGSGRAMGFLHLRRCRRRTVLGALPDPLRRGRCDPRGQLLPHRHRRAQHGLGPARPREQLPAHGHPHAAVSGRGAELLHHPAGDAVQERRDPRRGRPMQRGGVDLLVHHDPALSATALRRQGDGSAGLPVDVELECGRDEGVGRGRDAELPAHADDRAGQPGQLQAAAVLEVVEQRGLHRGRQLVGAGERARRRSPRAARCPWRGPRRAPRRGPPRRARGSRGPRGSGRSAGG